MIPKVWIIEYVFSEGYNEYKEKLNVSNLNNVRAMIQHDIK